MHTDYIESAPSGNVCPKVAVLNVHFITANKCGMQAIHAPRHAQPQQMPWAAMPTWLRPCGKLHSRSVLAVLCSFALTCNCIFERSRAETFLFCA